MRVFIWLFDLVLILLGVTFAALNAGNVEVNFYIKTLSIPTAVLITATFGAGLLLGFLLSLLRYWRLKMEFLKTKSQLKISAKEIKNLRDIPLKDQH